MEPIHFETHPSRYRHWKLILPEAGGPTPGVAQLLMNVDEEAPLRPGYTLKLNSYDLAVDLELADAVQRLRFEHPEVRLLGGLPGTGGLTRVVDKRRVRRDRADVFSTLAEGMRGKRAVEWRLVDAVIPRSKFAGAVQERALKLAASTPGPTGAGVAL